LRRSRSLPCPTAPRSESRSPTVSDRARLPVTVAALALAGVDPDLLAPFRETGTARGLAVAGELRDILSTTTDEEQL